MQRAFRVDDLKIVGDPHLGRSFVNNVPLHRRGDRELMVREAFVKALDPEGAKIHICLGDLFDKPKVSLETIWFAAHAYLQAARMNPDTEFFILAGNHDLSRDLTHVSAWDIFCGMLTEENIRTVESVINIGDHGEILLVPWNPSFNATEMVPDEVTANIAFGHWDLDGNSPNLIPVGHLADLGVMRVYNGHVHLPREEVREGIHIVNVGSLQPYAHGEGDELYVTTTLDVIRSSPDAYKDKCVRVRLQENETLDFEVDCLQLQVEHPDRSVDLSVDYDEAFDMKSLIARAGAAVPAEIWNRVLERL